MWWLLAGAVVVVLFVLGCTFYLSGTISQAEEEIHDLP